jgi:hypothetical protein
MAEMLIDIYASARGGVIILHDRPFGRQPRALELDVARRELWFVADGARIPFGAPITPALLPHLKRARSITLLQVTRHPEEPQRAELLAALEPFLGYLSAEVKPVAAFEVPLHLHGPRPGLLEPFRRAARGLTHALREVTHSVWTLFFPEL